MKVISRCCGTQKMCAAPFDPCSKRAKGLVALCDINFDKSATLSPSSKTRPVIPSSRQECCSTISPISSWWDDIFEASDLSWRTRPAPISANRAFSVKRRLCFESRSQKNSETKDIGHLFHKETKSGYKYEQDTTVNAVQLGDLVQYTSTVQVETTLESYSETPILIVPDASKKNSDDIKTLEDTASQNGHLIEENLPPPQAKISQTKLALDSGIEHLNTVGKLRKARKPLKPCKDSCNRCDKPKLDDHERDLLSKSFWNLGDHGQQWLFINNCIELSATKRKFCVKGTKGEKAFSRHYSFLVNGNHRKVCKTMFKSTLNVCDSWIVSALSHCSNQDLIVPDQRGKHKSKCAKKP